MHRASCDEMINCTSNSNYHSHSNNYSHSNYSFPHEERNIILILIKLLVLILLGSRKEPLDDFCLFGIRETLQNITFKNPRHAIAMRYLNAHRGFL